MGDMSSFTSVFRVRLGNSNERATTGTVGGGHSRVEWYGHGHHQQHGLPQRQPQPQPRAEQPQQARTAPLAQGGAPSRRTQARAKPRLVVSCHLCRARKQRCDRRLPCSTCVRRGDGLLCRYGVDGATAGSGTTSGTVTATASRGRRMPGDRTGTAAVRQEAQLRLQRLEELVNGFVARPADTINQQEQRQQRQHWSGTSVPGGMATAPRPLPEPRPLTGNHEWLVAIEPQPPGLVEAPRTSGPVSTIIGETPFTGATNWAAVLDSIRDIQNYLGDGDVGGDANAGANANLDADRESDTDANRDKAGGEGAHEESRVSVRSIAAGPAATNTGRLYDAKTALLPATLSTLSPPATNTAQIPTSSSHHSASSSPTTPFETAEPDIIFATIASTPGGTQSATGGMRVPLGEVITSLPSRAECDRLLTVYFQSRFMTAPFIHMGQFQRAYTRFWSTGSPASAHQMSPTLWLSMLASVLCIGATIAGVRQVSWFSERGNPAASDPEAPVDGEANNDDLMLAGRLRRLSTRCLLAGEYLNARPLSVEALLLNAYTRLMQRRDADAALWATFGVAARLAQRMGYQQVDSPCPRKASLTPFEKEMRRRVWYVVEAFDMLYSFQFGMPTVIHEDETTTNPPTNLRDDDFDESDSVLPPPRPMTDVSPTLYHCVKMRFTRQLRKIVRFSLWGPGILIGSGDAAAVSMAQDLASELHATFSDVPPSLLMPAHIHECPFSDASHDIMHRLVIDLLYHKSICVLYRQSLCCCTHEPVGTISGGETGNIEQQRTADELLNHQRHACLVSALRILDMHAEFEAETLPPTVFHGRSASNVGGSNAGRGAGRLATDRHMLSSLALHDFLLAATILCLDLIEGRERQMRKTSAVAAPKTANPAVPASCSTASPGSGEVEASSWGHLFGEAEPSLDQRANDRGAKLAALKQAYALWHNRRATSRDAAHAARILGAIVKKLSDMEVEGDGGMGTVPATEVDSTAEPAITGVFWNVADGAIPVSRLSGGAAMGGGLTSSEMGQHTTEQADATLFHLLSTASEAVPVPNLNFTYDWAESGPFDAALNDPYNVDWNMLDSFLMDRRLDVEAGSTVWSSDLMALEN